MDLQNKTLEEFLKFLPNDSLKLGGDTIPFYSKYETFKSYLDNHLHKEVTKAAIRAELEGGKDFNKIIWLNDHGVEHVKTVIERASHLLSNSVAQKLNAREIFLLLNAIQVHDIGNFYGRIGHESKVLEAINDGLTPILFDRTETPYIANIAQVHGGKVVRKDKTADKNTISTLKEEVMSDGYEIRQRVLAAILRFADELADDHHRADVKLLNEGKIPKGSEIFHAYASCLDTVRIDHPTRTVELHFKVPKHFLLRKFGKIHPDDSVSDQYLLDEIFLRSIKMHYERVYCAKFWKSFVDIEKIWVQIEFYSQAHEENVLSLTDLLVYPEITFTLQDSEYPSNSMDIYAVCPELAFKDGTRITGDSVMKKLGSQLSPDASKQSSKRKRVATVKPVKKKKLFPRKKTEKKTAVKRKRKR
jgi:hypothetical protein